MDTAELKYCKKCHKYRNIKEFTPNKRVPTKTCIICDNCKEINNKYYSANKDIICKFHRNKTSMKEEKKKVINPFVNCTYENIEQYVDKRWIEEELIWNNFKCSKCNNRIKYDRTNINSTISIMKKDYLLPTIKTNCFICCKECEKTCN